MHQFKIEVYAYNADGSIGEVVATRYADNPEQARLICFEYERQLDNDGDKAYHVELNLLCYKRCEDKKAFFDQFQA